jgi:predicted 3-demethylubiquinone-9 3-methyltransferase (glyoxalase superfamily)
MIEIKENPMPKITPFLWFDGKAHEAAKFYVSIFKKKSKILELTPMLALFRLQGQDFYALNGGPHYKLTPAFSLFVSCKTQKEVDYYWKKLLAGGKASRCGWLTDKYGLSWQIIPEILGKLLNDKDKKKANLVMQAMLQMVKLDTKKLKEAYAQE